MRKIVALTIALCLVFAAVVPSYAATEVVNSAWNTFFSNINSNVSTIKTYLQDFTQSWTTFFETMTGGTPSSLLTFQDLVRDVLRIGDWLAPIANYADGLRPSGILSIWDTLQSTMASVISNTSYNAVTQARATSLVEALTRQVNNNSYATLKYQNAHSWLVDNNGIYTFRSINGDHFDTANVPWSNGTPLGNIAYMVRSFNNNWMGAYTNRCQADLKHYNDNLTTWDSQGDALTQVTFTPESAIQGLYRYLAFTQRDVARLSYVFSNDAELQAREYAQETQETVAETFINPTSDASMTQVDAVSIAGQSQRARQNLTTGYSASGIWGGFDNELYLGDEGWFSTATANNLGYYPSSNTTRAKSVNSGYDTPLLDAYYEEILSLGSDKK